MSVDPRLIAEVAAQPYRFVYATVTGERLYGLAGAGDDWDVRAAHVLPARDVVGLRAPPETVAFTGHRDGLDFEFASHDLKKVSLMLLKKNGNVLEQVFSPLVVATSPEHAELKEIARACASRHLAIHFLQHAGLQWSLQGDPLRVKPPLLALRVLLTGIHLMRTGEIEANLPRLAEAFGLDYLPALLARRREQEDAPLEPAEAARLDAEYARLRGELEGAQSESALPPAAPEAARARLDALLVRLRLSGPSPDAGPRASGA